jgi:hypothetical protein
MNSLKKHRQKSFLKEKNKVVLKNIKKVLLIPFKFKKGGIEKELIIGSKRKSRTLWNLT